MAIALTPFLAFLNFLPLQDLLGNLKTVPELSPIIPSSLISSLQDSLSSSSSTNPGTKPAQTPHPPTEEQKQALKAIFAALMSAPDDLVKKQISTLVKRYQSNQTDAIHENEKNLVELALTLNEQYPGDVGVLCVFFLNVVELNPGEAAFLGANVPHAYLKGGESGSTVSRHRFATLTPLPIFTFTRSHWSDIIECMATSDNVVRAGLTPKLRDVPTLVEMLTYEAGPGSAQLLKPTPFPSSSSNSVSSSTSSPTTLYDPPIAEFSVLRVSLSEGEKTQHRPIEGPSLVIVTKGKGDVQASRGQEDLVEIQRGDVLFVAAGEGVEWSAGTDGLEVFRAFVEV